MTHLSNRLTPEEYAQVRALRLTIIRRKARRSDAALLRDLGSGAGRLRSLYGDTPPMRLVPPPDPPPPTPDPPPPTPEPINRLGEILAWMEAR